MEDRIIQALNQAYPIQFTTAEAVTNEMYRCSSQTGIYFVRATNYKSYQGQVEEARWLNYLHTQDVGVPQIIPSHTNALVEQVQLNSLKSVVVFQAAPGIHLPRSQWNGTVFRTLGQQIGKLHRVSRDYLKTQPTVQINHWYESEEYDFLRHIPASVKTIRAIADNVLNQVKELPKDESTYGLIHGDLWLENTLVDSDGKLTMIDFQDGEQHYYVYDLAVPIYSALEYSFAGGENIRDYERSITEALIEGYREESNLTTEMLMRLPLFLQLKEIFEYNCMHRYWDAANLSEEQVRIMNLYRYRLESRYG